MMVNRLGHFGFRVLVTVLLVSLFLTAGADIAYGKSVRSKKALSSKTMRSMARAYMAFGNYEKAMPLAEQALSTAKAKSASDAELSLCLIDLGYIYGNVDKLDKAEQMTSLGLQLQEKIYYDGHPYLAYTLRNLTSIYLKQGDIDKAKDTMDRAMSIMLDSHSPEDKAIAPFNVDLAKVYVSCGELDKAGACYDKALKVIYSSYGMEHAYTARVHVGLARLFMLEGQYDQADELAAKAQKVQEKVYGKSHHLTVGTLLTRAEICQARGDFSGSEKLIKQALGSVRMSSNIVSKAKLAQRASSIRASMAGTVVASAR